MAHNVDIKVFLIASTAVDKYSTRDWLNSIGATDFFVNLDDKTDAEALVELAGRRCYMSFQKGLNPNVTKIRTDIADYIDNILKSAHGSVLEHASYTFAIEGVSRVFTGEMNRHRAGVAVSEGSMRYIRFDDIGYWIPPSIQSIVHCPSCEPEYWEDMSEEAKQTRLLLAKKIKSRQVFQRAFEDAEKHYAELLEIWKDELAPESKFHLKKQITSMMRRIVPMGVATGGIWTLNLRAIRHVITMRCSPAAEEEICFVWSNAMNQIARKEPSFFGDFEQVDGGFWVPKYVKV